VDDLPSPFLRPPHLSVLTTLANALSAAGSSCYRLISSLSRWVSSTLDLKTYHTTVFPCQCLAPVRLGIIPQTFVSMPCSGARQMIVPKTTRQLVPPVSQLRMDTSKKVFTFLGHTQNGRLVFHLRSYLQIQAHCLRYGSML